MTQKRLHVISFDNPFPPVYGGVIDVFYKLVALHGIGYAIDLHCFADDVDVAPELKAVTSSVTFYPRPKNKIRHWFSLVPFAAKTRYSAELVRRLMRDSHPILFEGQQTTHILKHDFHGRKLLLRLHNLESEYFLGQFRSERNWVLKAAFLSEHYKYRGFTRHLLRFDKVLTLSRVEDDFVTKHSGNNLYVPVFHGNHEVGKLSDRGEFALYHGDLRLPDNRAAVRFLIDVFGEVKDFPLVVASGSGAGFVRSLLKGRANISFENIENPSKLDDLLSRAQINVMVSFQQSGTKLKVVNALYRSRFCLINKNMVDDPQLRALCTMAETKTEFVDAIRSLMHRDYAGSEREKTLKSILDDRENALKIDKVLD